MEETLRKGRLQRQQEEQEIGGIDAWEIERRNLGREQDGHRREERGKWEHGKVNNEQSEQDEIWQIDLEVMQLLWIKEGTVRGTREVFGEQ